jgi:hypothetical protein
VKAAEQIGRRHPSRIDRLVTKTQFRDDKKTTVVSSLRRILNER